MDHYEVLGVEANATTQEITRAFRKLAVKFHPDKNMQDAADATARFKVIREAHDVLTSPTRRVRFDAKRVPKRPHTFCDAQYDVCADEHGMVVHDMSVHRLPTLDEAFAVIDASALV